MLNISPYSVRPNINSAKFPSLTFAESVKNSSRFIYTILLIMIIFLASLWLPWTQNIRSSGFISTKNPYDRPQSIQSLIDGQIKEWKVKEGDIVEVGDTILVISEAKDEYLDPELLKQTKKQIDAKQNSIVSDASKIKNINKQIIAFENNLEAKLNANQLKLDQVNLKIQTDSLIIEASKVKLQNSQAQIARLQTMYDQGLKPLKELEGKTFELNESRAKLRETENKLQILISEKSMLMNEFDIIRNEFSDKIAKLNAEKNTVQSKQFKTEADIGKLSSSFNMYKVRSQATIITSPIKGTITKAVKSGIGEYIKAGEDLVTIVPSAYDLAVEMYVAPRDMPLLQIGQSVRLLFDGWPAIVFSGWPSKSIGTFEGEIFAMDNYISEENGKYRILITPTSLDPWPEEIRIGGGANALILLNDVKIYYELWRRLNGFPADFYKSEKQKDVKLKAPLKSVK